MYDYIESVTAKLCAFTRAYHSLYGKKKIFDDSFAYDLMGQHEFLQMASLIKHGFNPSLVKTDEYFTKDEIDHTVNTLLSSIPLSRIAYTEEKLESLYQSINKTNPKQDTLLQYLILGAGLDTFSFINSNPNLNIFEIDHPNTGFYKLKRINELHKVIPKNANFVGIDFNKDDLVDVMKTTSFDVNKTSFASLLGVTYYLSSTIFEDTVTKLESLLRKGSFFVFDFPDETTFYSEEDSLVTKLADMTKGLCEKMVHGYSLEEITSILEKHNFEIVEHLSPSNIQDKYFKNRSDGMNAFLNVHLVTAKKL